MRTRSSLCGQPYEDHEAVSSRTMNIGSATPHRRAGRDLLAAMGDRRRRAAWSPESPERGRFAGSGGRFPRGRSRCPTPSAARTEARPARNSARKFYNSFARGRGRGTITARGILHDVRGREVPVSRIRGGWWASIVNDPRCEQPLYVSSIECSPYELEAELGIGGETPPWSARTPLHERRTFGRYEDWRGFRPLGRHR